MYLVLLQFGPLQAGAISSKTKRNRTTTYAVLEKLMHLGLISTVQKGNVKIFQASPPKTIVALQEQKLQLAKELVPELEAITTPIKEEITVFKGRQGIKAIMANILDYKEYISFGSSGGFFDIMQHDFILFQKEKRRRRIKSRVILGKSLRKKKIVTQSYAEFHFIEDVYLTPTTTWVFGEYVGIIMWAEQPVATLIKSKNLAQSYTSYFELLWNATAT